MKPISTTAWHYKLVDYAYGDSYFHNWAGGRRNVSLCKYFWSVVVGIAFGWWIRYIDNHWPEIDFSVLKIVFGAIMAGMITGSMVWLVLTEPLDAAIIGLILGIIALSVGAVLGLIFLASWISDRWDFKIGWPKRRKKPRETSSTAELLKEFVHSKKGRFCPTLIFKEEGQS